jgi:hypothetical protein
MIAGYAADVAEGPDLLDIQDEVDALCSVIAAKTVRPPLSIGLFGDWGSGKSFFMGKMIERIELLARVSEAAGGDSSFCARVVQIRFNAWHYSDADLWASLVSTIFEELFEAGPLAIERQKAESDERQRLVSELRQARGIYEEAERDLEAARTAVDVATRSMSTVQHERRRGEARWTELRRALAALGRLAGDESFAELAREVTTVRTESRGLGERFRAVVRPLVRGPERGKRLALLAMFVLVPLAAGLVLGGAVQSDRLGTTLGALTGLAAWLLARLREVSDAMRKVERAAGEVEQLAKEQPAGGPEELVEALRHREQAAGQHLREAERDLENAKQAVEELARGRRFYRFLEERAASGDYRQRLGLISLVRRDLEKLSRLLDPDARDPAGEPPPVERIVLHGDAARSGRGEVLGDDALPRRRCVRHRRGAHGPVLHRRGGAGRRRDQPGGAGGHASRRGARARPGRGPEPAAQRARHRPLAPLVHGPARARDRHADGPAEAVPDRGLSGGRAGLRGEASPGTVQGTLKLEARRA